MVRLAPLAVVLVGCSTVAVGSQPSEEGMYSDDVGVEVDGVFVQCGNQDEINYFWQLRPDGAYRVREMPVVCMGPQSTTDFDLDDAVLIEGVYHFPDWTAEIGARCGMACIEAHDAETNETPVCLDDAFSPNPAWDGWAPSDGPNCDSTIFANREPEFDAEVAWRFDEEQS